MMGIPTICQVGIPAIALHSQMWDYPTMSELAEILPLRVQARLDALGKTKRGVSLAIGAHAGWVRDLFDPDRFNVPGATRLRDLAAELETTSEYLLGEADSPDAVRSEVGLSDIRLDWRGPSPEEPGIPLVGTGDCAELEVCSETGEMVHVERCSFDPDYHVRYLARPPALRGATDLYAIYFHGESMVPRFEPGEVGIVDPRRPVVGGDYVVVQLRDGESEQVGGVLVKRLVRRTAQEYTLEQLNPPLVFTLPARRVKRIHRLVPQTELLF